MKTKALVAGAVLIISSVLFAACGKAEDGKITTEPKTSVNIAITTTRKDIKDEVSSLAGDVSEGFSEAGSDIKKGITRLYE